MSNLDICKRRNIYELIKLRLNSFFWEVVLVAVYEDELKITQVNESDAFSIRVITYSLLLGDEFR